MFKAIAPSFQKPTIAPSTNNDRISSQIKQRSPILFRQAKCSKRSPTNSTNQRSQITSNQTTIAYFLRQFKCSKRSPISHKTMIAPHPESNSDRLFSQTKCSKRSPSHSQNHRSQLISNQSEIAYFHILNVQSDRPLIPQTNDRNSFQIKQRSLIFSDTLNVQSDRPLIPQTSDRKSPQIKQRSPISSDTLNAQSDRPLIPQTSDRLLIPQTNDRPSPPSTSDRPIIPQTNDCNSSQIKHRSPIFEGNVGKS